MGQDVRRRQRGLLLLTAHRAKGLEFDHVVVLDGGWDRIGRDEDRDAPRRLYYVAMTRARQTLALVRFEGLEQTTAPANFVREPRFASMYPGGLQPLLAALQQNRSVLRRAINDDLPPQSPEFARQYRQLKLSEIDLGFAGRHRAGHSLHRAIAALSPGHPLQTRVAQTGRWELLDRAGRMVGRLAGRFEPPQGTHCRSASVFAVVAWSREKSEPQYRDRAKCDAWEVVVPELIFEPCE